MANKDRMSFYVETNFARLVQIVVVARQASIKDVMLPGERVDFGTVHDEFIVRQKAQHDGKAQT